MSLCGLLSRSTALLLVCAAGAAQAMPFGIFDPRSMAMGGTGVSSGNAANAAYFNPALLSSGPPKDAFAVVVPSVAVRVADPDKLADDIDGLSKSGDSLTSAVDQINQAINQAAPVAQQQQAAQALANAIGGFRTELTKVNNKSLEADGFVAPLTIGVPGNFGFALYAAGQAHIGVRLIRAQSDDTLLGNYQVAAQQFATTGAAADFQNLVNTFGNGTTINDPNFQSTVNLRGIALAEVGISMAHRFASLNGVSLGITPKSVKVATVDYSISPQQRSDITLDQGRRDYRNANFDLGVASPLAAGWRGGLVGKNMLARSYETVLGNRIDIKPQLRGGLSHHSGWSTVAIDMDLTKNNAVGFDKETRFLAVGAELDVLGFLKLRAGYRKDLAGNYGGMPSAGLGLSLLGLQLDLAAALRGKEEAMAALQLSFGF